MSTYSGNTCNIITLFPMGVECSVVNSTSPYNYDGSVYLTITGGTPPYVISWSNGAQTQIITGLQYGTYTANVTDYYGDFTATTTCNVSTNFAAYLEEFFNCTNPSQKLYYIADTNFPYPSGDTFTITSQAGCWVSNGIVINTGQTFYSYSAITTSGPFEDCFACLPVTPEKESTSGMCLTTIVSVGLPVVNQYQFYSAGTMNGYPTWTSTNPDQKIYFNTAINQWSVSGWTLSGIPSLSQNISPPIGVWAVNGANRTVNVTQGNCGEYIIPTIQQVNPTCSNTSNGVINVVNVIGGIPPYTYSLDNIVYQNSNIFNNLQVGSYTVYVKDVIGNTSIKNRTLTGQQPITTYQINLSLVPSTPVTTVTTNSSQKIANWRVGVTPPLPANRSVSFTLYNTTTMSAGTASNASPSLVYSNTTGTTGTSQFVTSTITTTTNSYPNTILCHPNFYTTGITRTYNISLSGTGVVGGEILQRVVVVNNGNGCVTKGSIKDTLSIGNIVLNNQQACEQIGSSVLPITFSVNKEGSLAAQQNNASS
jgi:hypothetical protein